MSMKTYSYLIAVFLLVFSGGVSYCGEQQGKEFKFLVLGPEDEPVQGLITVGSKAYNANAEGRITSALTFEAQPDGFPKVENIVPSKKGYRFGSVERGEGGIFVIRLLFAAYELEGMVFTENDPYLKDITVAIEGQPGIVPAKTDDLGKFKILIPENFRPKAATVFLVGGKPRSGADVEFTAGFTAVKIRADKQDAPSVVVQRSLKMVDRADNGIPNKSFRLNNTNYKTDRDGVAMVSVVGNTYPTIRIDGYKLVSFDPAHDGGNYMLVQVEALAEGVTSLEAEVDTLIVRHKKDFDKVISILEKEKEEITERSIELQTQMEEIREKLSKSGTISEGQRQALRGMLSSLEKQLNDNEKAFAEAQARSQLVIEKMRTDLMTQEEKESSDSLSVAQQEVGETETQIDKVEQVREERGRLLVGVMLSVLALLIGIIFYLGVRKLKKQRMQLAESVRRMKESEKHAAELTTALSLHQVNAKQIKTAGHIQKALLPSTADFGQAFSGHFIFYRPKEVLSGDFYWLKEQNGKYLVAVADCTGHGATGALIAAYGSSLLNQASLKLNSSEPAKILEKLDSLFAIELEGEGEESSIDMALACIEPLANGRFRVSFSGARRPLFYLKTKEGRVYELNGSRQALGNTPGKKKQVFQAEETELDAGDILFLATNGITDQQGEDHKRFGSTRFKQVLEANAGSPPEAIGGKLAATLSEHQGNARQLDDITVIGIKL